jgi:hypothetical protein
MAGAVISVHVADAVFVTMICVQLSLPVAVTVLLTEHAPAGAMKLALKFADAWDARLGRVSTVLGEAWLSTTVTLFKVTLPEFVTVPVYVIKPPAAAGTTGQASVTPMPGVVVTVQVVEMVFVTVLSVQMLWPVPLKAVVTVQALAGTV